MTKAPERTLNRDRLQEAIDTVVDNADDIDTEAIVEIYVAKMTIDDSKQPSWYAKGITLAVLTVGGVFFAGLILRAAVEFFEWGYTFPETVQAWFGQ